MGLFQRMVEKGKSLSARVALCFAAVLGLGGLTSQAYAALPQDITAVFDTAKGNASDVGWVILGLIAAIMAFKFIRRAF